MRICFATSECVPFIKTGGLADVAGALPKALADLGHEVKIVLPLYGSIETLKHGLTFAQELYGLPIRVGDETIPAHVWYGHLPESSVEVYFIDCPRFFHRGQPYGNAPDEAERFILLQHATFQIMQRYSWAPDILHCNDWHTGLMPVMLRKSYGWDALFQETASVYTLHNVAYQGRFDASKIYQAGLPYDEFYPGGPFELQGAFCFMKAGLVYADVISTVSPTYAWEIQGPEHGYGLDGVLRTRHDQLHGILNGIDPNEWHPANDPLIAQPYDVHRLDEKEANKRALLEEAGLPYRPDTPVFGIVSRFAEQKGLDLLKPILQPLVEEHGLQFVVLGSGEPHLEDFFRWAAGTFPDHVSAYIGYNNRLAHRIEAGVDAFLMPSRFEPCGLNQMYSLAYGTVPIVRKTGGLADTVNDYFEYHGQGNGFSFVDATPYALYTSILRAAGVYRDRDAWRTIQHRGMTTDHSWHASAHRYETMYHEALALRRGHY